MKFKVWNGEDLQGHWHISRKLDGVRAIVSSVSVVSRSNKLLPGLQSLAGNIPNGHYEFYAEDFQSSVSISRSHNVLDLTTLKSYMYSLNPFLHDLTINVYVNPTKEVILHYFNEAIDDGYEGLVLYNGTTYLKVKSKYTDDVRVLDIIEGTNKNTNKLGAFLTTKGKVGIGFTDAQRVEYFNQKYIGSIIEVEYMNETSSGKLRMPRFVRLRDDKLTESIEVTV